MATLVAYDSSSEEEESAIINERANSVREVPVSKLLTQDEPVLQMSTDNAPIVGPFIPEDITQSYAGYEDEPVMSSEATERDMIRYLTQASHPMTEMPPSPPGSPNPSSAARFKHFLSLKTKGVHFNEDLARKHAFRNPALLQTLIDRAGLDSDSIYRSALPSTVFDTTSFPTAAYKEGLLKSQQTFRAKEDAEKKALSAAGKRTVEFTSGGISTTSSATSSPSGLHKRQRQ